MNINDFFRAVLPNTGYFCLFAANETQGNRRQKFFTSTDALLESAKKADAAGYDAYFALASFEEEGSRKVSNARELRAFFLDIDCGEGKPYPTAETAIEKLTEVRRRIGLPSPVIVSSGYGVHAYWPLYDSVPASAWLKTATKFKEVCESYGLQADPAITVDRARVLRVPGTHNYKRGGQKRVEIVSVTSEKIDFEEFSKLVGSKAADQMELTPTERMQKEMLRTRTAFEALESPYKYSFKDIVHRSKRGNGCAQILHAIRNQATLEEPLWRAALSIASACEDGRESAHKMSYKHPNYSKAETDRKFDEIKGPYGCDKFKQLNPQVCEKCPVARSISNPVTLGRYVPERSEDEIEVEVVRPDGVAGFTGEEERPTGVVIPGGTRIQVPEYPKPFFNGANNAVCLRKVDTDGEEYTSIVYRHPIYITKRVSDPEAGDLVIVRLHLPRDGVREFMVPMTALTSREEFRKHVSSHGVTSIGDELGALGAYMITWVNELQEKEAALNARRQFGWIGPDHWRSFVLGNREFLPDGGVIHNPPSTPTARYMDAFEPRGTLDDWKGVASFFGKEGLELYQFMICAALGAPLMDLTGWQGLSINLLGKTGLGKTTIASVGLSVWGRPDELRMGSKDTINSTMNRLEVFKNLPMLIDEVTNHDAKILSDLVYAVTEGRQKNRMAGTKDNTERFRGSPWALLAFMTSNASILDRISASKSEWEAEAQRLLEFPVERFKFDKEVTDHLTNNLNNVGATAGPVFIKYVVQNRQSVVDLLRKVQSKIDKAAGLAPKNRYWSAAAACTMTALLLAKQMNLVDYDEHKLFNWITQMLKEHKSIADAGAMTPEQILARYLAESQGSTLRIESGKRRNRSKTERVNAEDVIIDPEKTPYNELNVRYETDNNIVFLDVRPLKRWCSKEQVAYAAFVKGLEASCGAKLGQKRMAGGTSQRLPPIWALKVPLKHDELQGVMDEKPGGSLDG